MKVVYFAFNGEEFDTEEDCLDYEDEVRASAVKDDIVAADKFGAHLDLTHRNFADRLYVFCAKTQEAADYLADRFEREDAVTKGIDGPGTYIWGEDYQHDWGWVDASVIREELMDAIKDFDEKIRAVEG